MRRRRRPLRVLLLLIVVSAAAFYVLEASLRTEREYAAFVHQLASGQESVVLESRFARGWLRSRAQTSLEVAGGAGLAFRSAVEALGAKEVRSRVGVTMAHEIEHGLLPLFDWARSGFHGTPVLARIRSTIEIDQESQLALAESIGKLPPLEAHTVLRTAGQADTRFSIRGEHLKARGRGVEREGRWLGLSGKIAFSAGFRRIEGRVHSPGLESAGTDGRVSLRELVWEFDLPAGEFPVGRMKLSLAGWQLDSASVEGPQLAVEGLRVEGDSRLARGSFGAQLEASADAVVLGDERWGPARLRLALSEVDGEALRRIRREGVRLASPRAAGDAASSEPPPGRHEIPADGPQLSVEALELATIHGAVTGSGKFMLASTEKVGDAEDALATSSGLHGELDLRLPAAALQTVAVARARGELVAEQADFDAAGFAAEARRRSEAWIASLRASGRLAEEGALLALHTSWVPEPEPSGPAKVAEAQGAAPPPESAAAAPPHAGAQQDVQPPEAARASHADAAPPAPSPQPAPPAAPARTAPETAAP